ncbi:TadE/TadG family type IV pilus assembly protein [Sphingomonas psychrotolerans]|uniref:Tight adherence protein TadE n=1 Tax=Sphingomonas psychrotolerans TaxID=1327635 RepID=A0A2K8MC72_9SPHN|nr:tight adherence protein TadE [Sphingomonas psychrotolerans]ATY31453.1 tight adherence protein TadE [Sphingomonas psychrotolerans]
MKHKLALLRTTARRFGRDTSGLALLEFAFSLPIVLTMSLTGAELTNYVITKMRLSQIALQIADNSARMGSGSQLESKKVYESDINDLLTGADFQSGQMGLFTNGRVIISSVEPHETTANKYRIRWQRCKGSRTAWVSSYGNPTTTTSVDGVGPTGRQVIAPPSGVAMFVEVRYQYQPLIKTSLSPTTEMNEIASMMVRDARDTSDDSFITVNGVKQSNPNAQHPNGVYKGGVTASTC